MNTFDLYFSTIIGWSLHPGYQREGSKPLTIQEAGKLASEMMEERKKWVGLDQQSEQQQAS
jgi:hypothetical protein